MTDRPHLPGPLMQFTLPRLERVLAGAGALGSLPAEMDRYGCRRAVLVTGATVGASPLAARALSLLGGRCVRVFTGARQHVPSSTVDALVAVVREVRADALVSIGGGSPIDTAKCAVHALLADPASRRPAVPAVVGGAMSEDRAAAAPGDRAAHASMDPVSAPPAAWGHDAPVHVAVPTTLSAGEFTDVAGMTDEATRIKHAVYDTRLAPRTVIADPLVTVDTPAWLWAASGVRALDHAVETLYASSPHPISEPLAERAIGLLLAHLPASLDVADGMLAHRGQCQVAAWLAVFGVTNAGFGLSHVLGHQIGPRWNVPHGFTSAVTLPHAMRAMAAVAPGRFPAIARGFGIAFDAGDPAAAARACADRTAAFIERLGLPSRLREVGVPRDGLGEVADVVALMSRAGPAGFSMDAGDLLRILVDAY